MPYRDRLDAGHRLVDPVVSALERHGLDAAEALVLGLPRGGVVVAAAVAESLGAELDVLCVRKLGVPGHEELAFGALASGGGRVVDSTLVERVGLGADTVGAVVARETSELHRRERAYRGDRPPPRVTGRAVIVVDDGLATGSTATAACAALRAAGADSVMLAVPVAPHGALDALRPVADPVVCPSTPRFFGAVGQWYDDFAEVTDDEVRALLTT